MQLKCGIESRGQKKKLIKVSWKSEISKRKLKYVGLANRNPRTRTNLMTKSLQGRVPGSRRRGRLATLYMNNVR